MDTGNDTPQGMTSSADRMVGMEHSEVRYFTRYDTLIHWTILSMKYDANEYPATTTMVSDY